MSDDGKSDRNMMVVNDM